MNTSLTLHLVLLGRLLKVRRPGTWYLLLLLAGVCLWQSCGETLYAEDPVIRQAPPGTGPESDDHMRFFENEVRPLLVNRCLECHGSLVQSGGLRLDARESLLTGGDRGPAIVPGDVESSLLIEAVRRSNDLEMPPGEPLTEREQAILVHWVAAGAPWPEQITLAMSSGSGHWAFQPLQQPEIPAPAGSTEVDYLADWSRNPIDAFLLERLNQANLIPAPPADRRTLIRRASYSLTGLPPSPEEVAAFENDTAPDAWERLIDRLLASPHYGEQWARHWLDVARYSDTKGYVYAREERFWLHAWVYRDWVVQALNEDMPYDRFLLLQIAADQVEDRRSVDLAAMGFLTLGRRFLGVERDIIDDRIDVVGRGTMGLTLGCARCHDHKYDPIPTDDYYSLYGVFDSCRETVVPLPTDVSPEESYLAELSSRQKVFDEALAESRAASSARARARVGDYLRAQLELDKFPPQGFDQFLENDDLSPAFIRRWERFLLDARRRRAPAFIHWHAYVELPPEQFAERSSAVTQELQTRVEEVNPLVAASFTQPPASMDEVATRYANLLSEIDARWQAEQQSATEMGEAEPQGWSDPALEELRQVLYGPTAPCEVPDEPIVHIEGFFSTPNCEDLWRKQGEVDRWIINGPVDNPYALILQDRDQPAVPRVFLRGNPVTPGREVPRQFPALLSGEDRQPFTEGSGRLELARKIIDPQNPLTARVIVNRVWAHHFGTGLVSTPSDFGMRADPPSHPELLDWLARRLIEEGWSLKWLHRLITTSAAFQQDSRRTDAALLERAMQLDPENRLLWRMNVRRLSFEEFRDSLLATSGSLDRRQGGRPSELFTTPFPSRRTLYGRVDRQFLPNTLRMFDFANPDLHIPQRSETTVPQQALFLMNHPLLLDQTRTLVQSLPDNASEEAAIHELFRRAFQREPTTLQLTAAREFLQQSDSTEHPTEPVTRLDWQYGYGPVVEESGRVESFTPLPYFTGIAWQGGPQWPDATLGWVQLTATGGHPGNDRNHAAIRRWTAPRDMTIAVTSTLIHEPEPGDGVQVFVISSRSGMLVADRAHHSTLDIALPELSVAAGETIDFVVDVGEILHSDQFLWEINVTAAEEAVSAADVETLCPDIPVAWNSQTDFPASTVDQLTPLEQLAQLLLCSNEFVFID